MICYDKKNNLFCMAILVINLSPARHLDEFLAESTVVYASPRLEDDARKLEISCSYSPDSTTLVKRVNQLLGLEVNLIITYVDVFGFYSFLPTFENCEIPILAILGDTHHGYGALSKVNKYLRRSSILNVALKQTKGQARIFNDLGYNVFCFGTYIVNAEFISPIENAQPFIAAFGSSSKYHYRRNYILSKLREKGLPVVVSNFKREDMFLGFNAAAATLNIPLNSDVNYRFHEACSAGGLLLTEKLSVVSDQYEYLTSGDCYLDFSTLDQLVSTCEFALSDSPDLYTIKQCSYNRLLSKTKETALCFGQFINNICNNRESSRPPEISNLSESANLISFENFQEGQRVKLTAPAFDQALSINFPSSWLDSFNHYSYT